VNEVFRAEDLLSSTPRQILLGRALGYEVPRWFHAPLVVDGRGRRLAKRADDLSLDTLRRDGVDPRAIVSWVAESAGMRAGARMSPRELCAGFDLGRMSRQPASVPDDIRVRLLDRSRA